MLRSLQSKVLSNAARAPLLQKRLRLRLRIAVKDQVCRQACRNENCNKLCIKEEQGDQRLWFSTPNANQSFFIGPQPTRDPVSTPAYTGAWRAIKNDRRLITFIDTTNQRLSFRSQEIRVGNQCIYYAPLQKRSESKVIVGIVGLPRLENSRAVLIEALRQISTGIGARMVPSMFTSVLPFPSKLPERDLICFFEVAGRSPLW